MGNQLQEEREVATYDRDNDIGIGRTTGKVSKRRDLVVTMDISSPRVGVNIAWIIHAVNRIDNTRDVLQVLALTDTRESALFYKQLAESFSSKMGISVGCQLKE